MSAFQTIVPVLLRQARENLATVLVLLTLLLFVSKSLYNYPIGLMAAAVCRHVGARHVVVTDINEKRLELAEQMGFQQQINTGVLGSCIWAIPVAPFRWPGLGDVAGVPGI